jgi:superfamily II DNA or RNA helicase
MTARVVSQFPARYLLGLSATPYRRDSLGAAIGFYLGPITAELTKSDLAERLVQPSIYKRDTGCKVYGDVFTEIVSRLCENPTRNALIVGDVVRATRRGRKSLVLTDRVEHAEDLGAMLRGAKVPVALLHGSVDRNEREDARARLERGDLAVVVATGQLIGEGWDAPSLDTLFLTTPLSYHGRLVQYVGRVSRAADGKRDAIVLDYTDDHPMLWATWKKRRTAYEEAGYQVEWAPARAA